MTTEQKVLKQGELGILLSRRTNLDSEIAALKNELSLEMSADAMKIAEQFNAARDTRQSPFAASTQTEGK
jgi:hypothetical protein